MPREARIQRFLTLLVLGGAFLRLVAAQQTAATTSNLTNPVLAEHVDRFLELMNSPNGTTMNQTEYEERFAQMFLDAAPLEIINTQLAVYQGIANSWAVMEIVSDQSSAAGLLVAPMDEKEPVVLLVSISIDESDGRVNGLFFKDGDPSLEVVPETLQDAVAQLNDMGHNFNYLVAEVGDDNNEECKVLAGESWEMSAPLGSMFKFWVLGAVVDAIKENRTHWDQNVTVLETSKSLPSGIVQNDIAGSSRTVRELAELMISISDNTATDLLLELVGRENVEQALIDYGHHDPSLNTPFLKTKELFLLKLHASPGDGQPGPLGQEYINGTELEQRSLLTSLDNQTIASFELSLAAWAGGPIAVNELEWFGSPLDLCRVMMMLVKNEEASRIMAINPGIPDEKGIWSYIGFKGGSEPGVLGMAWYLVPSSLLNSTSDSGHHRVVTGTLWDPNNAIDENKAVLLLGALRDLSLDETFEQTETPENETNVEPGNETDVEPASEADIDPTNEIDAEPGKETDVQPGNEIDVEQPESSGTKTFVSFWLPVLSLLLPLFSRFL